MGKEKWIIPYLKQYKRLFTLSIVLGSLTILFGAALMFTSGYLISKSATRQESILMVYVPIVGVRTFGIARAVISYAERLSGHEFVLKILSNMRVCLYKIIEPQALLLRSRFQTGDVLGVLAEDIEHLQDFYLKTLFPSLVSLLIYLVMIILAGMFSVPFAILLFVLIGLLVFVGPVFSLIYMKTKNRRLKEGRHQLYQQFTDGIFGISDMIFSGRYPVFMNHYLSEENKLFQIETKKQSFLNWREIMNQIIVGVIVVVTIYWANGKAAAGTFSPTVIAAFALAVLSLLESFLPIGVVMSEAVTYLESIKRLKNVELNKRPGCETEELTCFLDTAAAAVEINHLSFGYEEETFLLDDVHLRISQGEKIAILGKSGAGKSTFINLLLGELEPANGEIL
jgi:ATP-binding cassette, subfamily C, bacterial CydC